VRTLYLILCSCGSLWAAGHPTLMPLPQHVEYTMGRLPLRGLSIVLASRSSPEDAFTVKQLTEGLARRGNTPGAHILRLTRTGPVDAMPHDTEPTGADSRESYHLRVSPDGADVRARSSAGLFYGVQTLLQLVEGEGKSAALPAVEIDDWPSLAYRGVMFDLSHGPLPTEDEIKREIDFLARWKGNQYYFYSELSIELKGYPLINPGGRYTQEQVRRIIAYARERHVDVVPCLEFFGHLHDLFRIERYANLAALPHGGDLNPRNPEMQRMLSDWVDQMAALFPSPWFHIGLDEPWELERAGVAAAGGVEPGALFLEHLNRMFGLVRRHGKRVLFWADVASGAAVFEKYPQLAASLPEGTVPVPWRYNDEKDYSRMLDPFQKAHVPQVIGTGIWAWDTIVPDFHVTFANIDGFLRDGRKFGTLGIVNTNWSDDAQILYRMTQPGVAYGAVAAWQDQPVDRANFFLNYCRALLRRCRGAANCRCVASARCSAAGYGRGPRVGGHVPVVGRSVRAADIAPHPGSCGGSAQGSAEGGNRAGAVSRHAAGITVRRPAAGLCRDEVPLRGRDCRQLRQTGSDVDLGRPVVLAWPAGGRSEPQPGRRSHGYDLGTS
jgi:hexosaminidase